MDYYSHTYTISNSVDSYFAIHTHPTNKPPNNRIIPPGPQILETALAEDHKAKLGTGGIPDWLAKPDNPAKEGKFQYYRRLRKLGRDWIRGKDDDMTQGELTPDDKGKVMNGKQSDEGIVAKKLAGKAAMASDPAPG